MVREHLPHDERRLPTREAAEERVLALVGEVTVAAVQTKGAGAAWLAFLLALACGFFAVDRLCALATGSRYDQGGVARNKAQYFHRHKDEFELVFVGSSRVLNQVSPAVFTRRLADRGQPLTSFNFGLQGMWYPELRLTIEHILAERPARLRYLVIELRDLDRELSWRHYFTRRTVAWHTPQLTLLVLRQLWRTPSLSLLEKTKRSAVHLHHLAYRIANLGLALPALAQATGQPGTCLPENERFDGSVALNPVLATIEAARLPELFAAFADSPQEVEPEPVWTADLVDLVARIRAHDVEPIFVLIPPVWERRPDVLLLAERGVLPTLFAYQDPAAYPEFHRLENLFNTKHLNANGMVLFTQRLADDFLRWAAARD